MPSAPDQQRLYEDLAQECERRRDLQHRDIFLVLAGDCAATGGRAEEAEQLRQRLLEASPHNLLRPFASFAEAMQSSDIREYVEDLRQQFPPDWSENLLASWRRESQATEADAGQAPSILDSLFGSEAAMSQDPWASAGEVGFVLPQEPEAPRYSPEPATRPALEPDAKPQAAPRANDLQGKSATPGGKARSSKKSTPKQPAHHSFVGSTFIYLLIGLVALAGLGLLGYVFARPFLKM